MHYSYSPLRVILDHYTKNPTYSLENKNTNKGSKLRGKSRLNEIWSGIQLERTSWAKYETVWKYINIVFRGLVLDAKYYGGFDLLHVNIYWYKTLL